VDVITAVYRVERLDNNQNRYKVDINAQENHMTGVWVLCCVGAGCLVWPLLSGAGCSFWCRPLILSAGLTSWARATCFGGGVSVSLIVVVWVGHQEWDESSGVG